MNRKKTLVLFALAIVLVLASCASKRAAFVDSTMYEAKTLKQLSAVRGINASAETELLFKEAEKQKADGQSEKAFLLADEAVLQLQLTALKVERDSLFAAYEAAVESMAAIENNLNKQKSAK